MNDQRLEREVSRALHELFPEPSDIAFRLPEAGPRHRMRRTLAVLGSAAAVAAVITGELLISGIHSPAPGGRPGGQPAASADAPATTPADVPAWARRCLPEKAPDRLGAAPEYLSLTRQEAIRLAGRRGDHLFIVGAGGNCDVLEPQVAPAYSHVVALVFSQGGSAAARVIAAERVSNSWLGPGLGDARH